MLECVILRDFTESRTAVSKGITFDFIILTFHRANIIRYVWSEEALKSITKKGRLKYRHFDACDLNQGLSK